MAWRSNREARKNTPSVRKIYDHWQKKGLPNVRNLEYFIDIEPGTCFACGVFNLPLHRAHIIPICYGGDNSLDNFHLLCIRCHAQSEGNKKYWNWFAYMRTHEWKYRWEWAIKILEMNGVDINQEAQKIKDLPWEEYMENIRVLLSENSIYLEKIVETEI